MPSIRQVAKEAGVSIATVSRVINGNSTVAPELKRQVLAAIERCNYQPSVGRKACDSVALLYVGPFTPGSPYDMACMEGMVNRMRESSFDLTIIDMRRDKQEEESYRQFFARKGICGAIVRSTANERPLVRRIAEEGIPIVVLGDHFQHPTLPFVFGRSKSASEEAVAHLMSLGHEDIAYAASDCDDADHGDRFAAYANALKEAGIEREDLVFRIPPHRLDGAQLLRRLMSMANPPTAIFCADPFIGVGLINEAHNLGIQIPEELSIVGFDDTDTRNLLYPKLTAVCQDSVLLGRSAFECLVHVLDGDEVSERSYTHHAWLEINSTTSPPPVSRFRVLTNGLRLPHLG